MKLVPDPPGPFSAEANRKTLAAKRASLRDLIQTEREEGRAFGDVAEKARLELGLLSDEPLRRAC